MEEEAERASKKAKTEEDAKDVETEDDEDEDEYDMKVNTWTDARIIQEYNKLCDDFRELHESLRSHPYDGKGDTMYEHLEYYRQICNTRWELYEKMEIILNIADERGIPGDRSEGEKLSDVVK